MATLEKKASYVNIFLGLSITIALSFLYFEPLKEIAYICWTDDDYSHGLILPLISLYMWWDHKDIILEKISAREDKNTTITNIFYYLVFFFGLTLLALALASRLSYFAWISFFPVVVAIVGLTFGNNFNKIFIGPFLLLLMSKPLPDSVVVRIFWPLQVLAAQIGAATLSMLKVPVYLSGNIIEIPNMKLMVEEACSGMRSVMALLTLSLIMIFFSSLNLFGKLTLVFSGLLLAILLNVFRVALTGVLAHFYDPEAATGFFHTFSGLIVFIVGLPVIFYLSSLLSKIKLTSSKKPIH